MLMNELDFCRIPGEDQRACGRGRGRQLSLLLGKGSRAPSPPRLLSKMLPSLSELTLCQEKPSFEARRVLCCRIKSKPERKDKE